MSVESVVFAFPDCRLSTTDMVPGVFVLEFFFSFIYFFFFRGELKMHLLKMATIMSSIKKFDFFPKLLKYIIVVRRF